MATLLVRGADLVSTFDEGGTVWPDGSVYVVDGVIREVGPAGALPDGADTVLDARGRIVMPGLVNTHHHFFQSLTRNLPVAQDAGLFAWLRAHYAIWARLTPDAVYTATKLALVELLLSGCTTSSDHTYIWPCGARLDDQVRAAREVGVRFHAARGAMSLGESSGGLPPDSLVEDEESILRDTERVIAAYHDPRRHAMLRVVVAPCSPFSVSPGLMRDALALARGAGVAAHTHLAETRDEADFCARRFGRTPVELAEDLGWVGPDVWHAHMVHPGPAEIGRLGASRTGVAHCPSSNMRLGSGIAPVRQLLDSGARVGLGVDGSASNDGGHLLAETRQAMLLQRVAGGPAALTAREALHLATRGGAAVLGRDDIGQLAPGMSADIVGFRLDTPALAGGAVHDPLAALVFCQPPSVDFAVVDGKVRVRDGAPVDIDLPRLVEHHNKLARALVRGE